MQTRKNIYQGTIPSDLIKSNLPTLQEENQLIYALRVMRKTRLRTIAVVDKKGKPVGLLKKSFVLEAMEDLFPTRENTISLYSDTPHLVADFMDEGFLIVGEKHTLSDMKAVLESTGENTLVVTGKNQQYIGLVFKEDLMREPEVA